MHFFHFACRVLPGLPVVLGAPCKRGIGGGVEWRFLRLHVLLGWVTLGWRGARGEATAGVLPGLTSACSRRLTALYLYSCIFTLGDVAAS